MRLLGELKLNLASRPVGDAEFVLPHLVEWSKGSQAAILRDFCRQVKITSVKFHDLRATFITQLLLKKVSLAQVMSIVGHTELKTTNAYLRVVGSDLDGATDQLSYSLPEQKLGEVINFRPSKEA